MFTANCGMHYEPLLVAVIYVVRDIKFSTP